ncbi:MAG: phage major capsid protein [Clostridia bacterium]|nr:phage major capsid protein [Clostridia bacterium]
MSMIKKSDAYALFEPDVMNEIIEGSIKQSAVLQMFRRLPNMSSNKMKMRVLDSLPMAYWVDAETNNGRKKLTKMAWDNKFITAEELAVIVPIKEDVLDDASYDIWADVRPRIVEAIGKAVDLAVLTGVNKPTGFRTDLLTSILNAGAVVTQKADQTLYSVINDAMVRVEESGYNPSGIIGGVGVKGQFRMMLDTSGQPIAGTEIGNLPKHYVDNGAWDKDKSLMVVGDFSQAVYSIRQDVTYKILDQAVIQDPATGEILYNLAQEDMVALRVVFRMGWEIPNPINALNPDEATRFPFASIAKSTGSTLTTQTLTVTVKDNQGTPAPISGAKVTVGGVSKKTNTSGIATFSLQAGDYAILVKKDGLMATAGATVGSTAVTKTITLA